MLEYLYLGGNSVVGADAAALLCAAVAGLRNYTEEELGVPCALSRVGMMNGCSWRSPVPHRAGDMVNGTMRLG